MTIAQFVVITALALLILLGAALHLMTPEERTQLGRAVHAAVSDAIRAAIRHLQANEPFKDFLRARTRWPLVTPLLVALNTLTFISMVFAPGPIGDPNTLVDWGGNFPPRTTNGEWWRLVAATFVHAGTLHFLATIAGLVPLGLILERAVGPVAFAVLYLVSGLLASIVSLWTISAMNVSVGASGAIFGMYGLLLASLIWAVISRPPVSMPWVTVKALAATAVVFFGYNLATDDLGTSSELAGLATGFIGGLVVARGVAREKPPLHRATWILAATIPIAILCAIPFRGITDARPEIARVLALEERTAGAYDAAIAEFRRRPIDIEALVQLIDRTIMPELQAARARVNALRHIPVEQQPLVTAAEEYFQLRETSWRRRAEGLLQSDMGIVREAEQTERAALEVFKRMRPAG